MDRIAQQMKKGTLEMVVLSQLARQPSYGYELLGLLDGQSGGVFRLKEGTLYPVLYRLEDDGLIKAEWRPGEGRATPKKYYAVTPEGETQLAEMELFWAEFSTCVKGMLRGEGKKPAGAATARSAATPERAAKSQKAGKKETPAQAASADQNQKNAKANGTRSEGTGKAKKAVLV